MLSRAGAGSPAGGDGRDRDRDRESDSGSPTGEGLREDSDLLVRGAGREDVAPLVPPDEREDSDPPAPGDGAIHRVYDPVAYEGFQRCLGVGGDHKHFLDGRGGAPEEFEAGFDCVLVKRRGVASRTGATADPPA